MLCSKCQTSTRVKHSHMCYDCRKAYNQQIYAKRKAMMLDKYHNGGYKEVQSQRYKQDPRRHQMSTRVSRMRRRGLLHGVVETFTIEDYEAVFDRFENKCFNCGNEDRDLQVDHHVPQHLGNPLTHENAVILCDSCNGTKGRQMPEDFYGVAELGELERMLSNTQPIE